MQKIWAAFLLWSKNKLWHYFDFTISQHCHLCIIGIVIFALALITMENTCNATNYKNVFRNVEKATSTRFYDFSYLFSAHLQFRHFTIENKLLFVTFFPQLMIMQRCRLLLPLWFWWYRTAALSGFPLISKQKKKCNLSV